MSRTSHAPVESPYLRRALIDNAVSLVTSSSQGRQNVMTASFFAESSHLPVLLRVAVDPHCLSHELITDSGWFGLSVLAQGQERLALDCGSISGRHVSKLESLCIRFESSPNGVPLLPNCITTSECRVVESISLEDHTLFVGELVQSYRQSTLSHRDTLLISDLVDYLDDAQA